MLKDIAAERNFIVNISARIKTDAGKYVRNFNFNIITLIKAEIFYSPKNIYKFPKIFNPIRNTS